MIKLSICCGMYMRCVHHMLLICVVIENSELVVYCDIENDFK